jgi:hypothetical protein
MQITNNNVPRNLIYGYELPEHIKKDFDYLENINDSEFFQYKGQYYDIGEFMTCADKEQFIGWHAYFSDSFFSGILIKFVRSDSIIVGRYFN